MKIDNKLLDSLQSLTLTRLADCERESAMEYITTMLSHIDKLGKLDTAGVQLITHTNPITNRFREDVPQPSMNRDTLLANAQRQKDGCFVAPKTVE